MPESQHIEYKQKWHDDRLKWVCGFANAAGGVLQVGVDDAGKVLGIADAAKLLEEHASKPYNPDIANTFFRAGETGKAVESSVESRDSPVETTLETGRRTNKKTPEAIMEILESDPQYMLQQVAELIGKTIRPVENAARKLVESGRLRRVGPKKGGHWEVIR